MDAGDTFEAQVGDVESWSKEVARVRVSHVIHLGLGGDIDG